MVTHMTKRVRLEIHNLFAVIKFKQTIDNRALDYLCDNLKSYTWQYNKRIKRVQRVVNKIYFVYDYKRKEFRFPIYQIPNVMASLGKHRILKDEIEIIDRRKVLHRADLNLKINKKYVLRDYQERYVELITNREKNNISLIDAECGQGKGLMSCASICKFNSKVAILVMPKYVEKWIKDIQEYTNIKPEDIIVLQGGDSLRNLLNTPSHMITQKVFIISLRTFSFYVNEYESNEEFTYSLPPQEFMKHIRCETLFNDETHQCFHALSHAMLYLDAKWFIGSTATFDTNDPSMKKLYDMIIPPSCIISKLVQFEPYVTGINVRYELQLTRAFKYQTPQGYNHNELEKSLLRSRIGVKCYAAMIIAYVKKYYITKRQPGDKCLLFFSSVNMCTYFSELLQKEFPTLNVGRYCQDDDYEVILTSDITCSTVISSGTAIDIPNLITVIQTISIFSLQSNVQSFGRLRRLKDKEPTFIWFWTYDIQNHRKTNLERLRLLREKFKDYIEEVYPKMIYTK